VTDTSNEVNAPAGHEYMKTSGGGGRRIQYFDIHHEPEIYIEGIEEMHDLVTFPDEVRSKVDLTEYFAGSTFAQPLVSDAEGNGMSLACYRLAPNHIIQRHWHDTDQIIFVVDGEIWQGNRCIRPGQGYFTKAGAPYSIKAGPAGCKFLEFRDKTKFMTNFVEEDPSRWKWRDVEEQ